MGAGGERGAASADGRNAASGEKGSDVENGFVDQALIEVSSECVAAAFDQNGGDSLPGQGFEDGAQRFLGAHEGLVFVAIGENAASGGWLAAGGPDDPAWLLAWDAAEGQRGIIGPHRAGTDEDRINAGAQLHGVGTRGGRGDPWTFARRTGQAPVEGHAAFGDDPGQPGGHDIMELAIERGAFRGEDAARGFDPGFGEEAQAAPAVLRIRVDRAADHAGKARRNECVGAGRGASVGAARFERDVSGGPAGAGRIFQGAQRFDFRVRLAGAAVVAARDDASVFDQHAADGGVGPGLADTAACELDRFAHEFFVGGHADRENVGRSWTAATRRGNLEVGWPTGLEPATTGITIRGSAIELRPPLAKEE